MTISGSDAANSPIRTRLNEPAEDYAVGIDRYMPDLANTAPSFHPSELPAGFARDEIASANSDREQVLMPAPLVAPGSESAVAIAVVARNSLHSHRETLSPALLSPNALLALDQLEAQSNHRHQLLSLLAGNGIMDRAVHMQWNHGADAHFGQQVTQPNGDVAKLCIRARLNEQAQYDIVGIDLHMPAFGATESIHLSGPPAAAMHDNASHALDTRQSLRPGHLEAYYSRSQLTEAIVRQGILRRSTGFHGASDSSSSSPSSIFSHVASKTGGTGPIRSRTARTARTAPYPLSLYSAVTSARDSLSTRRPTDDQVGTHPRNTNSSLPTQLDLQVQVGSPNHLANIRQAESTTPTINPMGTPSTGTLDRPSAAPTSNVAPSHPLGFRGADFRRLYALRSDGVQGNVQFLKAPPEPVADLCRLGIELVGRSFPPRLNRVDFTFYTRGDNSDRGFTTLEGNRAEISIALITDIDWNDDIEMQGMILFTVFHEVFLHALPDLRTLASGENCTTEQEDHDVILIPPNNSNPLFCAVKQVLPQMPECLRQYFLDAYVNEVEGEIFRNDRVDKQAVEQWYEVLNSNLTDINSPFWRA